MKKKLPKQWSVRNRRFLNVPKSECMGAVSWAVHFRHERDYDLVTDKEKGPKKPTWNGCININKEARDQWVSRKAHMRSVYAMRTELNKFITACEKAIKEVKDAKTKDST